MGELAAHSFPLLLFIYQLCKLILEKFGLLQVNFFRSHFLCILKFHGNIVHLNLLGLFFELSSGVFLFATLMFKAYHTVIGYFQLLSLILFFLFSDDKVLELELFITISLILNLLT